MADSIKSFWVASLVQALLIDAWNSLALMTWHFECIWNSLALMTWHFEVQGKADYALQSAGGEIVGHSAIFSQAPMPLAFRIRQYLAIKIPSLFSQPILPYASKVTNFALPSKHFQKDYCNTNNGTDSYVLSNMPENKHTAPNLAV